MNTSVKDFAAKNGLHKQTVFRVLKRLGIETSKSQGSGDSRGQVVSYITSDDEQRVLEALAPSRNSRPEVEDNTEPAIASLYDVGVCYLLRLEPNHDPNRFKVGFGTNLNERLRQHRCSAPFAEAVKTWLCRRLREKTAIECVTDGCERLHTEVFRASSIGDVEDKCERFFTLMPQIVGRKSE